jgi:uncharacterized protein
VIVDGDVEATMRDGTALLADVYRPAGSGPWPVLLARTPYGKRDPTVLAVLDPLAAARRGFLVVVQDVRGRFGSAGDWEPLVHEVDDGYDSVRWAASLPGSDGTVAMYGRATSVTYSWPLSPRGRPSSSRPYPHSRGWIPSMVWYPAVVRRSAV